MIRRIIRIDEEKCSGCGACASACHEGAIKMIDGIARLTREDYCDGLGDCLPACPTGAISFEEREAPAYDEAAVLAAKAAADGAVPGAAADRAVSGAAADRAVPGAAAAASREKEGCLSQWPVQIKLAPVKAPYFENARLLVAADCTAYAYGNFHSRFMKNKITLIGCPKLDGVDYSEKLTQILASNSIKSVTVVRMEVPCCGGIENAVREALKASGKMLPWQVVTISTDGQILEE